MKLLLTFLLFSLPLPATVHYVSTTGSASGDGTKKNPWDLESACDKTVATTIQAGDIVRVLAGNHVVGTASDHRVECTTTGAAGAPVLFIGDPAVPGDPWPSKVQGNIHLLTPNSDGHLIFQNLEVYNTASDWGSTRTFIDQDDIVANAGVYRGFWSVVPRLDIINCYIHDTQGGVGWWRSVESGTLYGNIIAGNGYWSTGAGIALENGIYSQNDDATGLRYIRHNVLTANSVRPVRSSGSVPSTEGYRYVENVQFPHHNGGDSTFISSAEDVVIEGNWLIGSSVDLKGASNAVLVELKDNVSNAGIITTEWNADAKLTVSGNELGSTLVINTTVSYPLGSDVTWDGNTVYSPSSFGKITGHPTKENYTLAEWISETGLDAATSVQVMELRTTGPETTFLPNEHDCQRGLLVVENWPTFRGTVSGLPGTCSNGDLAIVSDGASATDCSTGGGATENECICNGSNTWEDSASATGRTVVDLSAYFKGPVELFNAANPAESFLAIANNIQIDMGSFTRYEPVANDTPWNFGDEPYPMFGAFLVISQTAGGRCRCPLE